MRLEASLQARQEMRLKLAPQIIQSIEILQLTLLDLRERIDEELLENPLLEVAPTLQEDDDAEETAAAPESAEDEREPDAVEPISQDPESEPDTDPIREQNYEALEDLIRPAENEGYTGEWRASGTAGERDAKLAALENSPAPDISLEEHLRQQLAYYELDPPIRRVCEQLIANLDWRGYLVHPLEEIVASMDPHVTVEEAEEALRAVQRLDPPGVGARTIEECLLLQLHEGDEGYTLLRTLISEHFGDIARNRYPKVAKSVGCTVEELKQAIVQIARLNPIPGALYGESPAPHVIPDLQVELIEGEYRVMLEDSSLPSLRICSYYARRLQQKDLDPKTEDYLRKKLQSARWLIDAIQQRRSTVFNIASALVETQKGFFEKGAMHLRPLKMQDIADKVGVHVSTVSRAISGKYMQTPRGIYSLKHFFTGGVEREDGEMESWEVVRQKLLQIASGEDKSNPLSDEQIAEQLRAQGIDIARRTVSKYRKVLKIPSSRRRKEY